MTQDGTGAAIEANRGPRERTAASSVVDVFERAGALARGGDLRGAEGLCREAVAPTALLHFALGEMAAERGDLRAALLFLGVAVELAPGNIAFQLIQAQTLLQAGRIGEGAEVAERVLKEAPELAFAHVITGAARFTQRRVPEAIVAYERATQLDPELAAAWNGLGLSLSLAGKLDGAARALGRAAELQPGDAQSWSALIATLGALHRFAEAREVTERALSLFPDADGLWSNALFISNADPARTPEDVFEEHRAWGARLAAREAPKRRSPSNTRDPERRLRIGYVSADFRVHSVAFFMAPIMAEHAHEKFEIFCYFNSWNADGATARFRAQASAWRDVRALSDDALVERIRRDEIDILVDLAGYTEGTRMGVFAQKPASIQVAYLGYPNTTGLPTMDCRITDALADPPGSSERLHTEALVRLPSSFLCYQPDADAPAVAEPPAERSGVITFGSFNDYRKLNAEVIALWSDVLREVPRSRMIIKTRPLADQRCRDELRSLFEQFGVAGDRLDLVGADARGTDHLGRYASLDIALDTFPYHGTTTTCEALWMGVPVVTLAGTSHRSRVGVSLLTNAGLPDLVTETRADFVQRAAGLAADGDARRELRHGLRDMMRRSALMDATGFTRSLEESYREMWRRWCRSGD